MERDHGKFRLGESPGKPIGGNVSPEPLPQALYELASSRGYETQLSLAKTFGHNSNSYIGAWYTGKVVPSPEYMGAILRLFHPNDQELDSIIEPWREKIAEGKGNPNLVAGTKKAIEISKQQIKPSKTPLGIWIDNYAIEKKISLKDFEVRSGINSNARDAVGLNLMSELLQTGPEDLGLTTEETDELADAVAATIEQKVSDGYKFGSGNSYSKRIRKIQDQLQYTTFNGAQAAEILGTSKANISKIRLKLGLPLLLSEENIDLLAKRLDKTKEHRKNTQEYYKKRKNEYKDI